MSTAKNGPEVIERRGKNKGSGSYQAIIPVENWDGEKLEMSEIVADIKTGCKTFSKPILDLTTGNFKAKCLKCTPETRQACVITADPAIKPANRTKENFIGARTSANGKHGSIKDFVGAMINQGKWTRAQIIKKFAAQFPEAHAAQGGRYVTSAFNKKYSIKRWGKIAKQTDKGVISWK